MARTPTAETGATPGEAERFAALLPSLPGGDGAIARLRQAGMAAYAAAGLPGQKVEAWKYTSLNALRKLALDRFAEPGAAAIDRAPALLADDATAARLVFVNGLCKPELSPSSALPAGATLTPLAACLDDDDVAEALGGLAGIDGAPLTALNAALFRDGYVLRLAANTAIERPIEIVWLSLPGEAPTAAHTRNLVLAGAGSRATVVEYHLALGDGAYAANGVTEARIDAGADLRLYKVQAEGAEAFHIHTTVAELAESARLESFALMLGAKLARNEVHVALQGRAAAAHVNGAYALADGQHADTLTDVDHAGTETLSRQVFKGVLDGASRAVFQGKVLVRPGARGTDGQQLNKTLLLSPKAEIDTKPELEIHADDVKCAHGATAGELAEDAMFYLRSRGIPEAEARHMLVEAFLEETVTEIGDAAVAEALRGLVQGWLAGHGGREGA